MGFGDYPAEYDPKIHGPYDPARYYGKGKLENSTVNMQVHYVTLFLSIADKPFGELKLSEIGEWFGRRNKSPNAVVGTISRGRFNLYF